VLDDVDSGRSSCDFFLVRAATKPPGPDDVVAGGGAAAAAEDVKVDGACMTKLVDCWRRSVSRRLLTSSCSDMSTATMFDRALWFSVITSRICPMS